MTGRQGLRAVVLVGLLGFLVGVALVLPFVKVTEAGTAPSAATTKVAAAHVPTGGSDDRVGAEQVDPAVAAGPNRSVGDGSGAKKSGVLSAVAVIVLALIVAGTAAFGSRRSSR